MNFHNGNTWCIYIHKFLTQGCNFNQIRDRPDTVWRSQSLTSCVRTHATVHFQLPVQKVYGDQHRINSRCKLIYQINKQHARLLITYTPTDVIYFNHRSILCLKFSEPSRGCGSMEVTVMAWPWSQVIITIWAVGGRGRLLCCCLEVPSQQMLGFGALSASTGITVIMKLHGDQWARWKLEGTDETLTVSLDHISYTIISHSSSVSKVCDSHMCHLLHHYNVAAIIPKSIFSSWFSLDVSASDPNLQTLPTAKQISLMVSSRLIYTSVSKCWSVAKTHVWFIIITSKALERRKCVTGIFVFLPCVSVLLPRPFTTWGHGDNVTLPNKWTAPKCKNPKSRQSSVSGGWWHTISWGLVGHNAVSPSPRYRSSCHHRQFVHMI